MSYPTGPLKEHPSTYIVEDRDNQDELDRLVLQDKILTVGMGGVLPELADPSLLRRVLDVGCGTGGWLMEMAKIYPMIKLFGVDVSSTILAYACAQAESEFLDKRISFRQMDALRMLEFRDAYFDLVNQRLGASWLRTWEWKKLLLEYHRVLRPGGTVRITEMNVIESNSPALTKLGGLALQAFYNSGRLFAPTSDGLTGELIRLLTQHGFEDVQTRIHIITLRAGTSGVQFFQEDMAMSYRLLVPFFQHWVRMPSDYDEIYRSALEEMQHPNFQATWTLLTVWATNGDQRLLMRGLQ